MVLSKDELAKHDGEASMFHRCAEAHNAMTATLHTIDGSQAVIGVTHSVQKPDGGNPIPREPHPPMSVTYHHETPDMRQVLAFHHVGVANDGTEHTAIFENTEHKASEIATLMSQDGMEDATSVRDAVIMQPTEGPYKGKFLYRKEPPFRMAVLFLRWWPFRTTLESTLPFRTPMVTSTTLSTLGPRV